MTDQTPRAATPRPWQAPLALTRYRAKHPRIGSRIGCCVSWQWKRGNESAASVLVRGWDPNFLVPMLRWLHNLSEMKPSLRAGGKICESFCPGAGDTVISRGMCIQPLPRSSLQWAFPAGSDRLHRAWLAFFNDSHAPGQKQGPPICTASSDNVVACRRPQHDNAKPPATTSFLFEACDSPWKKRPTLGAARS